MRCCLVRIRVDIGKCRFASSPRHLAHMFHPTQPSFGFTRVTSCPSSSKRCFVTIPSELKLTDCCVLDHAERVALPHCVTLPLVLLRVSCCFAQSLSVYTFAFCANVLISIKHFALGTIFQVSCDVLHVHLVALSGTGDFSCCLVHAVHNVNTLLAHVQQLSHGLYTARFSFSSLTSDSVVGVLFTLGVVTCLESRPSTAITSRMYFGFVSTEHWRAVLTITLSRKKF